MASVREPHTGFVWIAISATRRNLITSNVAVVLIKRKGKRPLSKVLLYLIDGGENI
jgi:hypothetical protein